MAYFATPAKAQAPGSATNGEQYSFEDNYVTPVYVPSPSKVNVPPSWTYFSCVEFAKSYLGIKNQSWGFAGRMQPNTDIPFVGAVVLTTEGGGHAAVITAINDSVLSIIEANYKPGAITQRVLTVTDPRIRGYYDPRSNAVPVVPALAVSGNVAR